MHLKKSVLFRTLVDQDEELACWLPFSGLQFQLGLHVPGAHDVGYSCFALSDEGVIGSC